MVNKFSVIGKYHKTSGENNQDVVLYDENEEVEIMILSDGVSLCSEGLKGAEITCRAIRELVINKGRYFLSFGDRDKIEFMMSHVEYELESQAKKASKEVEEYSATISCAVLDKKEGKVFLSNLGDAMIIGYKDKKCELLISPSDSTSGTYVNTNRKAVEYTNTRQVDWCDYDRILITSDGAWRLLQENGRISRDVNEMICMNDFSSFNDFLISNDPKDDCSYICMSR